MVYDEFGNRLPAPKAEVPAELAQALLEFATRLDSTNQLRWLVDGGVALLLHGLLPPEPPEGLDILGDRATLEACSQIFAAELNVSLQQYADASSQLLECAISLNGVAIDLAAEVQLFAEDGVLPLDLATIWPRRVRVALRGRNLALVPLEELFAAALLLEQREEAMAIARHLHSRGYDQSLFLPLLEQVPILEEPLWEVLDAVWPIARRARRRQIIRAYDKPELQQRPRRKRR